MFTQKSMKKTNPSFVKIYITCLKLAMLISSMIKWEFEAISSKGDM